MTPVARGISRVAAVVLGVMTALLAVGVAPAWAHITIASSSPGAASSIDALPGTVLVTFTGPLQALAEVVVTAPDGTDIATGEPSVEGATLTQRVTATSDPGQYAIAFRVTSTDGHVVTGRVGFAVGVPYDGTAAPVAGSTATTSTPRSTAPAMGSAGPGWLSRDVVVPTTLLLLALGAWLLSRRESPSRRAP